MDKLEQLADLRRLVPDGASVIVGGSGIARKPMALIGALLSCGATRLHLITPLGGPDADLLIGAGRVRHLHYAYVGFDIFGAAPHFRRAREAGALSCEEWSEGHFVTGLEAAARRLPFLPSRSGLASDLLRHAGSLRTFPCPLTGETLVAVPSLRPDVALLHVNAADWLGNAVIEGDLFLDPLIARAARVTLISTERLVETETLRAQADWVALLSPDVTAVFHVPGGARFTSCYPFYRADREAIAAYLRAARDGEAWARYVGELMAEVAR